MSEFSKAFVKAQQKMGPNPKFDKKVQAGNRTYEYVSLGAVLQHVIPACNENGISVTQEDIFKDGVQLVKTTLEHVTGEKREYFNAFCGSYSKPQEYGTIFTYTRRYALYGIFSLYGETDTDAQEIESDSSKTFAPLKQPILGQILTLVKGNEDLQNQMKGYYKVEKFSDMTEGQLKHALEFLQKPKAQKVG